MEITPGKPTVCRLTLVNHTTRVDRVTLSAARDSVRVGRGRGSRDTFQPYERKEVTLAIHVPKTPAGVAGKHDVTFSVNSTGNPDADHGSAEAHWTVLEFWSTDIDISPTKTSGFTHAAYSVTLHNEGNGRTMYALAGTRREQDA